MILPLALGTLSLACGIRNPLQKTEIVSTAAALAPTIEAVATDVAPTLNAVVEEAGDLAATAVIEATEFAPTLEAAVEDLAPTVESVAGTLVPGADAIATALPLPNSATPSGGIEEYLSQLQGNEGLSGLDSFRQTAVIDFEDSEQTGRVDYWGEFTTSPRATHGRVEFSGQASAGLPVPAFEYIVIEEETWIKLGLLPWQNVPQGVETVIGQQPYSADSFLLAAPAAQRVMPDQTVNGIECKHYVYSKDDVSFQGGNLETASGEIFTAVDGGYVVRYTLHGVGSLDNFFAGQTGNIHLVYDLFDVNVGLEIQPPR
jgi:hypothetical protein